MPTRALALALLSLLPIAPAAVASTSGKPAVAVQRTGPPSAPADETPSWAKPYLGGWSFYADGEGGAVCGLKLVPGMSIGGAAIEVSATCRRNFPLEDVAGWRLGDEKTGRKSIVFIDALRKPVLTLTPGPEKSWQGSVEGPVKGEPLGVIFERGAPKPPKSTTAQFKDEAFDLSGPNNAESCGFDVKVQSATAGTMTTAGRCAKRFKDMGLARWSIAGDKLTLSDRRGQARMTLRRADPFTFQAEVAGDMPVFFGPGTIDGSCLLDKSC